MYQAEEGVRRCGFMARGCAQNAGNACHTAAMIYGVTLLLSIGCLFAPGKKTQTVRHAGGFRRLSTAGRCLIHGVCCALQGIAGGEMSGMRQ